MPSDDAGRAIGKVVSVSAEKFVVELLGSMDNFTVVGFDDVHYVACLGSFVMIPVQAEYVVAEVVGLWQREAKPARDVGNRGELDKTTSSKFLDLVPVGMLPQASVGSFRFGVSIFPSLYADALYILDGELDRVFEVANWEEQIPNPDGAEGDAATRLRALTIGSSVVFQGYAVKVRIDEYFGGHSAILGNTGSGKSCTVASVMQSLFEKQNKHQAHGATFVVLDVNGEYRRAFAKLPPEIARFYLRVSDDPELPAPDSLGIGESTSTFRLPHWYLSVEEWELLLRASERTQQPVLRTALGLTSLFSSGRGGELDALRNHILSRCVHAVIQSELGSGAKRDRIVGILSSFSTDEINMGEIRSFIKVEYGEMKRIEDLVEYLDEYLLDDVSMPGYTSQEFEFDDLGAALDLALLYEEAHGNRQIRDYCAQMITRFKWIRERREFAFLRVKPNSTPASERNVDSYVARLLGFDKTAAGYEKKAQAVILDMNEAADEVVELASAVVARLVFERLRVAKPRNRLPVNFVLEEAHRYVSERPAMHAIDASRVFERIAKEGRKYGMFLMVASQRPSELSKTVLSQCSNFIVHRIQNPDDLIQIRQMTPFVSESVMKRLPSLPKQHALIFGNSVNLPTTFKVRDVDPKPESDDAPIRELWFVPKDAPVHL